MNDLLIVLGLLYVINCLHISVIVTDICHIGITKVTLSDIMFICFFLHQTHLGWLAKSTATILRLEICRSSVSIITSIQSRVDLRLHGGLTQITATNVIKMVVSGRTIAYDDTGDIVSCKIVVILGNWTTVLTKYVTLRVIDNHGGRSFL